MSFSKARQGSSLLVSLLALTLVTIVASKVFKSVDHQSKILTTAVSQNEVFTYLQAGEAWAEQMLLTEALEFDNESRMMSANFELDEGHLFIRVIDLQSCLNLNQLAQYELQEQMRSNLNRLSSTLGVSNVWVDIVSDWVDEDDEITGYGKESFDYLNTATPYQAANTKMVSDYEWNMLDVPQDELQNVIPYVCSLPVATTSININTASDAVLKSMLPDITDSQISYIERLVEEGGIKSMNEVTSHPTISNLNWADDVWSIDTDFIGVLVNLKIDNKTFWLHSEIARNDIGVVKAYFRSMSEPNNIVKARFLIEDALNES